MAVAGAAAAGAAVLEVVVLVVVLLYVQIRIPGHDHRCQAGQLLMARGWLDHVEGGCGGGAGWGVGSFKRQSRAVAGGGRRGYGIHEG